MCVCGYYIHIYIYSYILHYYVYMWELLMRLLNSVESRESLERMRTRRISILWDEFNQKKKYVLESREFRSREKYANIRFKTPRQTLPRHILAKTWNEQRWILYVKFMKFYWSGTLRWHTHTLNRDWLCLNRRWGASFLSFFIGFRSLTTFLKSCHLEDSKI